MFQDCPQVRGTTPCLSVTPTFTSFFVLKIPEVLFKLPPGTSPTSFSSQPKVQQKHTDTYCWFYPFISFSSKPPF